MPFNLLVNDRKVKASASLGWYRGEEWRLFRLVLLEFGPESLCIIDLMVLKFNFYLEVGFSEDF